MRLIDLTMPIWEGAGYGEILPFTNSPVRLHEYMYYDKHGMRMTRMKLDGETGSPFMVPHQRNPFDPTPLQPDPKFSWLLDEIPLEKLILGRHGDSRYQSSGGARDHARRDGDGY